MHEQRQRLLEDLSGVFAGEVACDPLTVAMFSSDASWYQIEPLGVAFPRNRNDVIALAKYAGEAKIPLIPRGAGSSVTGGAVGHGIVVDCSRHLTKIEMIGADAVRVQAGVVLDDLNAALREHGRYFPPDPSNPGITTIGSMLATDAAGSRSMRIGSTRDHVRSIEVVLPGGACVEFGNEPLDAPSRPKDAGRASGGSAGASASPLAAVGESVTAIADSVTAIAEKLLGGASDSGLKSAEADLRRNVVSRLARVLAENESLIHEKQPAIPRNCSGYYLRNVLSKTHLNVARMLVGSEGTLGLFTAATLHTSPLPTCRGVVLLQFDSTDKALEAVQALSDQLPSACDLLDRRLLTLAREAETRFNTMILSSAEAALIVEQVGFSEQQARDRIQFAIETAKRFGVTSVTEAFDYDSVEFLWSLPRTVVPHLNRVKGASRPQPFVEAIAVPPQRLREFLTRAQKVFQKHEVIASLYSHAAAGQLHLRPFLPNPTPADAGKIESLARELYGVVFEFGGTISGEHGDGLSRTSFLRSQYGSLYRVFQQVKDIFDPQRLMNPGKKLSDDPHLTIKNLRPTVADFAANRHDAPASGRTGVTRPESSKGAGLDDQISAVTSVSQSDDVHALRKASGRATQANSDRILTTSATSSSPITNDNATSQSAHPAASYDGPIIDLKLKWRSDELFAAAAECNGCGMCRTKSPELRMCPFFKVDPSEAASPRAKANLMRAFASGAVTSQDVASDPMQRIANLCFNCKQCELECPSNVNVSQMMIEAKAAHVAEHGLSRTDWLLSRAHSFGAIGCLLSWLVNWGLNNRHARWLLEKTVGIHRDRKLPTFARRPWLSRLPDELTEFPRELPPNQSVVYFVDHYANFHDPDLGRAFLEVLRHNGLRVHIPPEQTVSGMAMISAGDLDAARKVAEINVRQLAELAREGLPIVCTEPTAALCLKHEYPRLLDHPDVALIASRVTDATTFLAERFEAGQLKTDFSPLKLQAAYHPPCHLKALHSGRSILRLLEQIPDLEVVPIEKGCSGMAGTFGLTRTNFATSLEIGRDLIRHMSEADITIGLTECSSCKLQMEQGTTKPTVHPIKLLALAYGLLPELQNGLNRNTKRLTVS